MNAGGTRGPMLRAGSITSDQIAEGAPLLSIETGQITLREGSVVVGASVDGDTRNQKGQLNTFQIGCLPHDILPRKIVPALLEQFDKRTGDSVSILAISVVQFYAGRVLF